MTKCKNCGRELDISRKTFNFWRPFCNENCYWSWLAKGGEDVIPAKAGIQKGQLKLF